MMTKEKEIFILGSISESLIAFGLASTITFFSAKGLVNKLEEKWWPRVSKDSVFKKPADDKSWMGTFVLDINLDGKYDGVVEIYDLNYDGKIDIGAYYSIQKINFIEKSIKYGPYAEAVANYAKGAEEKIEQFLGDNDKDRTLETPINPEDFPRWLKIKDLKLI